jgi:hypothetical protein
LLGLGQKNNFSASIEMLVVSGELTPRLLVVLFTESEPESKTLMDKVAFISFTNPGAYFDIIF